MTESREYPGNLPLLPMGLGGARLDFDAAEDFWQAARKVTDESSLKEHLDLAMSGESSPRIWLFLHEPGAASLSCAAALDIARELGARDQAVLMLDCDDREYGLTRWAGRQEKEGWIDLVLYGASVLTSGVALPFGGRRGYVLGVGSFVPTDIEPQEAQDLIHRLKRQADDLLLVAPADDLGQMWARMADIRLLCWDRARTSAAAVEEICTAFEDSGDPLTGLIGFGLPGEELLPEVAPVQADDSPAEKDEVPGHGFGDEELVDPVLAEETPAEFEKEEVEEDEPAEPALAGSAPGSGSSRVFWVIALVCLSVIVAASFFYWNNMRVTDPTLDRGREPVVASAEQAVPDSPPEEVVNQPTEGPQDLPEAGDTTDQETMAAVDQDPPITSPAQADVEQPPLVQDRPEEPMESSPSSAAPETRFSMDPYLQEVGSDGWALHLYSLPDRPSAEQQAAALERRGFRTEIRPFVLKDKGLWYRVYVGSFLTRREALEAKDPLLETLNIDWARVTEF
jgi:hypothetical protein|nr:SPOR domain-containing protein [Candidatus Krumholzibacteria bacterium]